MIYLINANIIEALGLSWQKMLLHLANFVVLALVLIFLIYKPVKKFMQKRQDEIKQKYQDAEDVKLKAQKDIDEANENAQKSQEAMKQMALEVEETKKQAEIEKEQILIEAKEQAEKIKEDARVKAQEEKELALKEAKDEVVDMAVNLAGNILQREIKKEDNSKIIDEALEEWNKKND